jgi:hypothetical protein
MKTIVNKLRFALLLGFIAIGMTVLAQDIANIEKMSVSTQMFLNEMAGKISFDDNLPVPKFTTPNGKATVLPSIRPIARPDTLDGEVYISAFVRITDDNVIRELESMGVQIQSHFNDGLLTTLIPVKNIENLAALEGVTYISVATLMKPKTNFARQTTNTDDVLTNSADAVAAGLSHRYDGTGILIGVIDGGIDFQHIAFKDKNGNPRIKRAYRYAGSGSATDYTGTGDLPTADATNTDHGTHTSSIAGGSSVIVSGTNVTVTDDHANATYGGMAPGADLFLCGISDLQDTYIANSIQKICDYADSQNQPVVVNNSWGLGTEDHDGNSTLASVFAQYFGDSHPNHICIFASGNEAGMNDSSYPGGYYVSGTGTSSSPLGTIIRSHSMVTNAGYQYYGVLANACTRATNATSIAAKVYVLNASGAIQQTRDITSQTSFTPTGMTGTLSIGFYTLANGKKQIWMTTNGLSGTNRYLAIEIYVTGGSNQTLDVWAGDYDYFTNFLTTSGHTWVAGTDDMTVGDEATDYNVISVGSYVSRYDGDNSAGDISSFSSYAVAGVGPSGRMQPWITAPGEVLISAMNHSATEHDAFQTIVNNANNPYGTMSGTSMASPAATGIVALWLQAAQEVGKTMTTTDIKNIMAETAIHDQWTNGAHASHFGNGKINALGGIEYILREYGVPTITTTPSTVTFNGAPGGTYTQTVTVGGIQLTDDIIATLNDETGTYSINRSVNLGNGGDLVISYAPTSAGTHNATITLTSNGAPDATITINGRASIEAEATVADGTTTTTYLPIYGNQYANKQINQMIYPASMLTEIQGKRIKAIKFYAERINFSGGAFNVSMGTTTTTTYPNRNHRRLTGLTTVKTGQAAQSGGTELVITFDQPFEYTGDNLVIDFEVTATNTNSTTRFYGVNPGGFTSFYSYGGTVNSYGRYSTGGTRLQFLPKVTFIWDETPIIDGNVTPTSLTFTDVPIGGSAEQTVTVSNSGNVPFTPNIDTSDLPTEFEVTGNGNIQPDGSLNLTVTYTPTDAGPHSGSFTVSFGDQTFTVNVTGNGVVIVSTLTSNTLEVPVYKSDMEVNDAYIFSQEDVENDIDMHLSYDDASDVSILVKSDEQITGYDLKHKPANGNTWSSAGTATHQDNSYIAGETTMSFGQDETEMWFPMNDPQEETYDYVPVTVANSIVAGGAQGNTYGAPIRTKNVDNVALEVIVGGSKSDQRPAGRWDQDGVEYCVYTPVITINSEDLSGVTHIPYMFRAWLLSDDVIYDFERNTTTGKIEGTDPIELPYCLGTFEVDPTAIGMTSFTIGRDWIGPNGDIPNDWNTKLENAFGAPCEDADVRIVVRAYYQKANSQKAPARGMRDGGGYGFGEGNGDGDGISTWVMELNPDRQVVGVTYVNPLGMTSDRPFEGVNIIVTRYSDGSSRTSKVMF